MMEKERVRYQVQGPGKTWPERLIHPGCLTSAEARFVAQKARKRLGEGNGEILISRL
jgi:hypothetical protein